MSVYNTKKKCIHNFLIKLFNKKYKFYTEIIIEMR